MARPGVLQQAYGELDRLSRHRYGIPGDVLLAKLEKGESGGSGKAVSGAGARAWYQFMPGTRKAVLQYTGGKIDPWRSEAEARDAAVLHLTGKLGNARGLEGYNPGGGSSYVHYILGQKVGPSGPAPRFATAPAPSALPAPNPNASLAQALQQPQGTVSAPPPPAFAAKAPVPQGFQPPPGVQGNAGPDQGLAQILRGPADLPLSGPAPSLSGGLPGAMPKRIGAGITGRPGRIIGTPYAGTHAKAFNVQGGSDNWQSENAVDIAIPVGTPIYAFEDGVLGNTGSLGQGGRFSGLRTNLIGKGNSFYYAHLSKLAPGIRAGARVKAGQLLGYSGEANGVAHLHFAVERGNPATYARLRRR